MSGPQTIDDLVAKLRPELQQQVREFVEALITKEEQLGASPPRFEWAGALADLRDRYTSVELQHQIGQWRP